NGCRAARARLDWAAGVESLIAMASLSLVHPGGVMRRALAVSLFAALVLALPSLAVQESKGLVLKVLVPEEDAVVTVNDKKIDGNGKERVIKVAEPPKGKDFHLVTGVW